MGIQFFVLAVIIGCVGSVGLLHVLHWMVVKHSKWFDIYLMIVVPLFALAGIGFFASEMIGLPEKYLGCYLFSYSCFGMVHLAVIPIEGLVVDSFHE